jgi:hypothetical protein
LRKEEDGRFAVMPKLIQILEEETVFVIRIEDRLRRRPNTPGSSERRHFERANQKKGKRSFIWSAPTETGPEKELKSQEHRGSKAGHEDGDLGRFTWTVSESEPHVEPPRPPGWKLLVINPQFVQLSEEAERTLADQRMKEWSKDQKGYTEREFQLVQAKHQERAGKEKLIWAQLEAKRRLNVEKCVDMLWEIERDLDEDDYQRSGDIRHRMDTMFGEPIVEEAKAFWRRHLEEQRQESRGTSGSRESCPGGEGKTKTPNDGRVEGGKGDSRVQRKIRAGGRRRCVTSDRGKDKKVRRGDTEGWIR